MSLLDDEDELINNDLLDLKLYIMDTLQKTNPMRNEFTIFKNKINSLYKWSGHNNAIDIDTIMYNVNMLLLDKMLIKENNKLCLYFTKDIRDELYELFNKPIFPIFKINIISYKQPLYNHIISVLNNQSELHYIEQLDFSPSFLKHISKSKKISDNSNIIFYYDDFKQSFVEFTPSLRLNIVDRLFLNTSNCSRILSDYDKLKIFINTINSYEIEIISITDIHIMNEFIKNNILKCNEISKIRLDINQLLFFEKLSITDIIDKDILFFIKEFKCKVMEISIYKDLLIRNVSDDVRKYIFGLKNYIYSINNDIKEIYFVDGENGCYDYF